MRFKGKVTKEFIEKRNRHVANDSNPNPYFRWDSEWPENHQAAVDRFQTLYEGMEYDTTHDHLGNLDYKLYAKAGVHISPYIEKKARAGLIDYFVVWSWAKPWNGPLEEGQTVEYDILGHVDAQSALKNLREVKDRYGNIKKRFTFPL